MSAYPSPFMSEIDTEERRDKAVWPSLTQEGLVPGVAARATPATRLKASKWMDIPRAIVPPFVRHLLQSEPDQGHSVRPTPRLSCGARAPQRLRHRPPARLLP